MQTNLNNQIADKYKSNSQKIHVLTEDWVKKHPDNNHVKDKIRQQLQLLQDKGYLSFVSRGRYKLN
ncbi:hypothetical protein KAI92_01250 [Candidatus Parcubacteria bacterium]|nr:hypothetical protein [Candidatus Parcubacteria bacterium]